jgi:hypothetical protein
MSKHPETETEQQNGDPPQEAPNRAEHTAGDAFRVILDRLAELRAHGNYYVSARVDQLKLTGRQIVHFAAFSLIWSIFVAGAAVTAFVLVLQGIAGGLAVLCGHTPWLGDLLCGVLVLGMLFIGLWFFVKGSVKMSRQATMEKYEREQIRQRSEFGRDADQRVRDEKST